MAFPGSVQVASNTVYTYVGSNTGKKIKVSVTGLQDSVVIYVVKTIPGSNQTVRRVLQGNQTSVTFDDDNGTVQIMAALSIFDIQLPDGTRGYAFGKEVSFDDSEPNNAGAEVFYSFQANQVAGRSISGITTPTTTVDLQDLPWTSCIKEVAGPAGQYMTIGAVRKGANSNGLVEGQVALHFYDPDASGTAMLGVMRDTSKLANDQGAPFGNIENGWFDINNNDFPDGVFIVGLVQFAQRNGKVIFEIGDPKDNGDVQVEEV